jgi:hypothetical protein
MVKKQTYEEFYAARKDDFENDLKLIIRKHCRRGNEVLPLDGGMPSDYGHVNDEDMGLILAKAANEMQGKDPVDYLYHHPPLPKRLTAKEAKEWLKTLKDPFLA